jgi:hypothetical protein
MRPASYKLRLRFFAVTLCMTTLLFLGVGSQQGRTQDSTQASNAPVYLPPGNPDTSILTWFLSSLGEPSLLEAAKDPSILSYRLSYFTPVATRAIVVRVVVNADGSGQITTATWSSGKLAESKRAKDTVSAADVKQFLQLVEQVEFWSMPSTEQKNNGGRTMYVLDGSWCMIEGARNGSFHYALRRSLQPDPFTQLARHLAKNLAKIDNSVISIPEYTSPGQ